MRLTCLAGQVHLCSPVAVRIEFSVLFVVISVESKCISERKLLVSNQIRKEAQEG